MNKTFLIFKHEFSHLIKRKSFVFMTLIVPVLALVAIGIIGFIPHTAAPSESQKTIIGYVDQSGGFSGSLFQGSIQISRFEDADSATQAMLGGKISQYFSIPANYIATGEINLFTLQKQLTVQSDESDAISNFLVNNMLNGKVPEATIIRVESPLTINTTTLTKTGEVSTDQGGYGNFILPAIFSILFALSMVFSSSYMVQGMGDEKENRLMEILLSSVSPSQLLVGKVLGLGTGGLVQVGVWVASLAVIFNLPISKSFSSIIQLPPGFLVLGLVYFILGYFLFAVIAAIIGAVSPTLKEGQQYASLYTMFAIAPLWFMSLQMFMPNSPIWTILTIFPLTAPTLVIERLGLTDIPVWELATSIAVLAATLAGALLLSSKIFKVYLLMYGKRPRFKEILKNLK